MTVTVTVTETETATKTATETVKKYSMCVTQIGELVRRNAAADGVQQEVAGVPSQPLNPQLVPCPHSSCAVHVTWAVVVLNSCTTTLGVHMFVHPTHDTPVLVRRREQFQRFLQDSVAGVPKQWFAYPINTSRKREKKVTTNQTGSLTARLAQLASESLQEWRATRSLVVRLGQAVCIRQTLSLARSTGRV